MPPLAERIRQITELAQRHDPQAITWRFDPLCFFRRSNRAAFHHHLDALETIADALAAAGIRRCVSSFVDLYPKVRKRLRGTDLALVDPPLAVKVETLSAMAAALRKRQIVLHVCCEQTILDALSAGTGIRSGACIPGPLLAALFGGGFAMKKDPGQRRSQGCTCNIAADIGSYRQQPCYHDCLVCYANPQAPSRRPFNQKRS